MEQGITKETGLKRLIGSGDKIMLFTLPWLVVGLVLNILFPEFFSVGGPSTALAVLSIIILIPGVTLWLWSAALVLTKVPKGELITHGPYALVKHPLYTSVGLLVFPAVGFLLDTWLGLAVGVVLYLSARRYAPEEEEVLSQTFGHTWDDYCKKVKIPWL
jgi:protein-S-isoprenylcysteine O-methyltransferase Ste14